VTFVSRGMTRGIDLNTTKIRGEGVVLDNQENNLNPRVTGKGLATVLTEGNQLSCEGVFSVRRSANRTKNRHARSKKKRVD